jgi:A/G-specific adenine glycosylase
VLQPRPDAEALLAWYDRHRRRLPWRAEPGEAADPYRVWLSEIMLQQTTVAAVIPYFARFLDRFPTIEALAAAEEGAVMAAWAGLGYYARARNLHACARAVAADGGFPRNVEGLRALPGIGPYTSAAIAAIAFGIPAVAVDGNVERVAARLFAITEPLPAAKPAIAAAAVRLGTQPAARARASDFAQALFDLGATICTPATPACALCPWRDACGGRRAGIAAELPRKSPKPERPLRHGVHFWLTDDAGRVLLRRRPPRGLLGGMTELPGTPWRADPWEAEAWRAHAPMPAEWRPAGEVRHGLTHFELRLALYAARVPEIAAEGFLRPVDSLEAEALPSVMRKCVAMATSSSAATAPAPPRSDRRRSRASPRPSPPSARA